MPTKHPQQHTKHPQQHSAAVYDPADTPSVIHSGTDNESDTSASNPTIADHIPSSFDHDKPVVKKRGRRWSKEGTVKYVESAKVVLDDGDGADWPCFVRGDAKVTINGVKAHRADINNGDKIRVAGGSQDIHTVEVARDGWEYPTEA